MNPPWLLLFLTPSTTLSPQEIDAGTGPAGQFAPHSPQTQLLAFSGLSSIRFLQSLRPWALERAWRALPLSSSAEAAQTTMPPSGGVVGLHPQRLLAVHDLFWLDAVAPEEAQGVFDFRQDDAGKRDPRSFGADIPAQGLEGTVDVGEVLGGA
ncbi:hypothetical protein CDD83_4273 [Cordyceps sp. RAO-2017]|nr:hypothetical protein CDD83_4273 [Cordyceps sp. RAO-2017]